jgi:hypothetical protein
MIAAKCGRGGGLETKSNHAVEAYLPEGTLKGEI